MGFGLKNEGEVIRLYDAANVLIDSVHYGNKDPWPELADGNGYSLILKSQELDNDKAENWTVCLNGSPSRNNLEVTAIPENPDKESCRNKLDQNFPNPCSATTTFTYTLVSGGYVSIKVQDISGNEVLTLVSENQYPDSYSVTFDVNSLSNGLYFYSLRIGDFLVEIKKFVVTH
jgi:hypothetical protein